MKAEVIINFFLLLVVQGKHRSRPNIVLFITDDQDSLMNGMEPLQKTKKLLKEKGTTFNYAFTTSPLCCPSRASILTGLYQHNHNVLNNSLHGGCSNSEWQRSHEVKSFAVELQKLGYSNFYAGKYLNQYGSKAAGGARHIPPGWERWIGLIGNSKYYNYSLSIDGKQKYFTNHYLTKVLETYALDFIEKQNKSRPFLMVVAPPAPHQPFTPEPKYRGYFEGTQVPRTPQFNLGNNFGKHWLVRMPPSPLPEKLVRILDDIYARRWETLLSVDDLVESVLNHLGKKDFLENTYFIFTSDNGFHLGQFSFAWDKRQLYEFDIKVPFVVRGPGIPENYSVNNPVILSDIAPTLLHIGGSAKFSADGKSFLPINEEVERMFLIEYKGEGNFEGNDASCWSSDEGTSHCASKAFCKCQDSKNNTYSCLRGLSTDQDFIYCSFEDKEGFEELYDLKRDPYQLSNIVSNIKYSCKYELKGILNALKDCRDLSASTSNRTTGKFKIRLKSKLRTVDKAST